MNHSGTAPEPTPGTEQQSGPERLRNDSDASRAPADQGTGKGTGNRERRGSDSPSTPPSRTSTREQDHDMDGPTINLDIDAILHEHWLLTDDVDRIVGSVCGYRAPITEDGYDYGDRVVRHLLEVAAAWAEPVVVSGPVSPVDLDAIEADLAEVPPELFTPRTIGDGPMRRLIGAVPALVAEVRRLRALAGES